jgi:hypothetical protein
MTAILAVDEPAVRPRLRIVLMSRGLLGAVTDVLAEDQ